MAHDLNCVWDDSRHEIISSGSSWNAGVRTYNLANYLRDEFLARVRWLIYGEDVRRRLQVESQRGA